MSIQWRLYFHDHSTHDDTQGDRPPDKYIEVIVFRQDGGARGIIHGHDCYWLRDGVWYGGDMRSAFQHVTLFASGITAAAWGLTLLNPDFQAIKKQAMKDTDFLE